MANFYINNNEIGNNCNNGQGKCCGVCQYVSRKEGQWEACSDSCFDNSEIKEFSCIQCKHKADWVK